MPRTFIRQETQIRQSDLYDDQLAAGSALETAAVNIEDDLNGLRSQVNRIINSVVTANDWFTNITSRGVNALNTDLADIEGKKLLCRSQVLTDIPTDAQATGTITTIAGSLLVDGETFVLDDGVNPAVTFEFDDNGSVVPSATLRPVNFTGADTADQVRDAIIAAVNTAPVLDITAYNGGAAFVVLWNDNGGTAGNQTITETVVDAGFIVTGMAGGATGQNWKILIVAQSQAPTEVAAVLAATNGTVVAQSALSGASFDDWEATAVTGPNAISPKNLALVRDATTGQPIQSSSRDVFALFQYESTGPDGGTFNDVSAGNRAKLSFVRLNAGFDALEACPIVDIQGKRINYSYVSRTNLDIVPEDCFLGSGTFTDLSALTDVTLSRAIANQSGPAVQAGKNIEWRIDDTFELRFQDSTGTANIFKISPDPAGDDVQFNVRNFDVNNTATADFNDGIAADTGGTPIQVGVNAGVIETISTSDLRILGAGELYLDDGNQVGSTWAQTAGIKLSDTTVEWDNFELAFGEVSLLNAIVQANSGASRQKGVAVVTAATINADVNVTGAGGTPNIDAQLPAYTAINFVTGVDVYLNGVLLRNGADASANHDVYPGDVPANGDLKFEFKLKGTGANPDVITLIQYGTP